jgi:hypothetical protein
MILISKLYICVRVNEFKPSYFLFVFETCGFVLFLRGLILLHRYPSHVQGVQFELAATAQK